MNQLPHDYSSTPGGTLFSTTPGGTRIIYDRGFLLQMRGSPLTKTPPTNLPNIPGVTCKFVEEGKENKQPSSTLGTIQESPATANSTSNGKKDDGEEPQFSIEM
ncbi:eukaryotic translation initiation factor 4E binding protein-like protein [Leptotrombidium deliense]|uniref:Eukaryotic translation initiation factor 4E binding protein-like protein n=1 Tax=Leptotrombidium deliense TaxID=299467 RepID=A0A443S7Y7_9ACAR|nr:eukaryotic translation initiation factor 4E binding protein-like protein [Leptotrombidium deliense]